jgi:hypothetical protein
MVLVPAPFATRARLEHCLRVVGLAPAWVIHVRHRCGVDEQRRRVECRPGGLKTAREARIDQRALTPT